MPDSTEAASPRVSVLIPSYNLARYLPRAIESILSQTFTDLELVIVDDGSSDDSPAIITRSAARDPRVRFEIVPKNGGISSALNRALELSRATLIARLDGDDIALPDRLARQVAFLEAHPETGMVGGAMTLIDEYDRKLVTEHYILEPARLRETVKRASVIASPATMFRRKIVVALGGWRSSLNTSEDYDMMLRISERAELANLPDVVTYYRMHSRQETFRHGRRQAALAEAARIAWRYRQAGRADPIPADAWIDGNTLDQLPLDRADVDRLRSMFSQLESG